MTIDERCRTPPQPDRSKCLGLELGDVSGNSTTQRQELPARFDFHRYSSNIK